MVGMKVGFSLRDYVTLGILFCIALYMYSLPFQDNPLPFGEGDAAWHFAAGDYMTSRDRSMDLDDFPVYIHYWYYNFNPILGPGALQYPPPPNMVHSFLQIGGGERYVPVRISMAFLVFIGIFSVYFLLHKLYNNYFISSLSAFALIFSVGSHLPYLFRQQATFTSIVFFPLVIYCTYRFLNSLYTENREFIYFYLLLLLLVCQFMYHILGLLPSFSFILVYTLFSLIRNKKIPLDKEVMKHLAIVFFLGILLILPFFNIYWGAFQTESQDMKPDISLSRFFVFGIDTAKSAFSYVDFLQVYPGIIFVVLLFVGLTFILFRRSKSDLIMLMWLISLYLFFHLDILGIRNQRMSRLLELESQVFYPIAIIGLFALASFIKVGQYKKILNYALAVGFIVLVLFTTGTRSYAVLDSAYNSLDRLTPTQVRFCEMVKESDIEKDAMIFNLGTITYAKNRWLLAVCQRNTMPFDMLGRLDEFQVKGLDTDKIPKYVMFDYSDYMLLNQKAKIEEINQVEADFANNTLVFNQDGIRVYRLENQ